MAGTINLALTQQFDMDGEPLGGGLLQTLTAGTTTPQPSFQDFGLTILHPNPIVLDASGRVPMFYLADGFIKIILKDKNGVVIIAADQMLVIGPSTGTSGGAGVDVTTVLQTGDIKPRYGTGVLDGFVRCNGLTIGQSGSSATELAGPKAQALYEYLWTFSNITLDSAVKGASATADFGALKRLILPDLRGRVIAGMDDMGATAASRLTSTYFGASGIVVGNVGGNEKHLLTIAELPAVTPAGTVTAVSASGSCSGTGSSSGSFSGSIAGSTHNVRVDGNTGNTPTGTSSGVMIGSTGGVGTNTNVSDGDVDGSCSGTYSGGASITGSASVSGGTGTFNGTPFGSGLNHAVMSPAMVLSIYIKL